MSDVTPITGVWCRFCRTPITKDGQGFWTNRTPGDEALGLPDDEWGRMCLGDGVAPRSHEPSDNQSTND